MSGHNGAPAAGGRIDDGATLRARAPGKTNLCLFLGPTRPDGLHALVSLIEPLSLADELTLEPLPGAAGVAAAVGVGDTACAAGEDEVVCAGIEGPNLAGAALAAYRAAAGWDAPPQRLTIVKRVPVAAGMGGGSADAAAALRLAAHAAGRPGDPVIARLAAQLGADVPSQVGPGLVLVGGAGEDVQPAPPRTPHGVLVLPSAQRLATAEVYRAADRLGLARSAVELEERRAALADALAAGPELPAELLVNDLELAALSLCPAIDDALMAAADAGADCALVSGSGPTVVGLFWGTGGFDAATGAAAALRERFPGATAARPVDARFAAIRAVRDNDGRA
jgi:4-diphosphocytidyl-2-C-methyl-D-erythritol kinase